MTDHLALTRRSNQFDAHSARKEGECFDVLPITGQHGAAGLGERDDERVNRGAVTQRSSKFSGPTRQRSPNVLFDDASLQETVCLGVAGTVPLKRFNEHHAGHDRGPQAISPECFDQRQRPRTSFAQPTEPTTM